SAAACRATSSRAQRPTNETSAPARASHAAVFAALPPGRERMSLGASVSLCTGARGTTMMSSMTSPKTRTRSVRGIGHGDLGGDADVVAHEVEVHLEAASVRALHDVAEEEGGDGLPAHAGLLRRRERLR